MNNYTNRNFWFFKQLTKAITFFVCKMFRTQQGIAKSKPRGNLVFIHQIKNVVCIRSSKTSSSTAPKTILWRAVNGSNITPIIKIFRMFTVKRKKDFVQFVKLEKSWKMVVGGFFVCSLHIRVKDYTFWREISSFRGIIQSLVKDYPTENKLQRPFPFAFLKSHKDRFHCNQNWPFYKHSISGK